MTTAHVPAAEAGARDYPNNCVQKGSAYFCDYNARTEPWVCRLNAIEGSGHDVDSCLDALLAAYNAYAQAHPELFGGLRYTRGTACGTPFYTGIVRERKPWLSSFATSCGVQPYYPDGRPWLSGQSIVGVSMDFACHEGWHTYGSGPEGSALDPVCLTLLFPKNSGPGGVCPVGNPVNPATGNKYQVEVDYAEAMGVTGLSVERHYNSSGSGAQIGIGEHWRLGFDRSLGVDDASLAANARRADGRIYLFRATASGYVGDPDVNDRLSALRDASGTPTAWEYRAADTAELERYDASGRLLSVTSRAGLLWSFEYSDATTPPEVAPGPGLLTRVVAPSGRSLRPTYDGLGRVVSIEDPGGALHRYAYDAAGNLATFTEPDGALHAYRYEHPRFLHALTGIVDENGQRFATFVYDDAGRALLTEHAGGAQRHAIAYSPTSTSSASVTDPLGTDRGYEFTQTQRRR